MPWVTSAFKASDPLPRTSDIPGVEVVHSDHWADLSSPDSDCNQLA